jgi:hypothetical protein
MGMITASKNNLHARTNHLALFTIIYNLVGGAVLAVWVQPKPPNSGLRLSLLFRFHCRICFLGTPVPEVTCV